MTGDLYRDEILEHYREPLNFGTLNGFHSFSKQSNPFCGDEIEIYIRFEKEGVEDISFRGKGCAISIASGSILTEYAKRKTKKQLTKFGEDDMLSMIGVELSETRKKCALLALSVLQDCLK